MNQLFSITEVVNSFTFLKLLKIKLKKERKKKKKPNQDKK